MKLILHIGFHKTGSTAIQAFWRMNRDRLARLGILYPRYGEKRLQFPSSSHSEGAHRSLEGLLTCPDSPRQSERLGDLIQEATSIDGIHSILISSEVFSPPHKKISPKAHGALRRRFNEVEVVVYLRRQDYWAESFYKERLCWAHEREQRRFADFCEQVLPAWLDYASRLLRWEEGFGLTNLLVRSYDDRVDSDMNREFCRLIGVDLTSESDLEWPSKRNPTLPNDLVPLMLEVNGMNITPEQKSSWTCKLFQMLADEGIEVEKRQIVSRGFAQKMQAKYEEMNHKIADRFGVPTHDRFTFSRDHPGSPSRQEITLSADCVHELRHQIQQSAGLLS